MFAMLPIPDRSLPDMRGIEPRAASIQPDGQHLMRQAGEESKSHGV
jgi:hypothetical protein